MRYSYTIVQCPPEFNSKKDEMQAFLNEINSLPDAEITHVVPLGNRYFLVLYKS